MKASIKFREDQKPLARAKIPLNIAGLPFQSGIVAGESKELSLNLATFFDSGPSLKLAYKPNDSLNPFTLVFRTGIGHYGSPINSPMIMSAEFNLIGTQNPRFFIHFKPKLGDFSIKKSQSSDFVKGIKPKQRSNGNFLEEDILTESTDNGLFYSKKIGFLTTPESAAAGSLIGGLLSGMEATANTVFPVMNRAVVNFRWGVRFSQGETAAVAVNRAAILVQQLPLLVMNKIGIEHVAVGDTKDSNKGGDSVADTYSVDTYSVVKRQMELIQFENEMLKKTMNDLKSEFAASKWTVPMINGSSGGVDLGKYREGERGGKPSGGRLDWRNNANDKKSSEFNGKASEGDANGELKKKAVIKDAVGA